MESVREINALIHLLDDTDQEVFKHVYEKLKSFGIAVIPTLEKAWGDDLTPATHERLEEIIHEIQFDALVKDWKLWLSKEQPDLLSGVFLIAKYHYPEILIEDLQKKLFKVKQSIWLELNYNQTALEQIQIFNQVFYNYQKFQGTQMSTEFQDFCINHVLDTKKGSAVAVGIVYQILANELNIPIYGVTLTHHYILAFCKKMIFDFNTENNLEREVMFYVNPINRGSVFSRSEIKDYLEKMNVDQKNEFFLPSGNQTILKELLHYLIELYEQQNQHDRCGELAYLAKML